MIEKQKVEWFISRLRPKLKRAMKKIYLTFIEYLQVAVKIEPQPWRVNIVKDGLSSQIMKLKEKIDESSMQGNSIMPPQHREILCQLFTKEGHMVNEFPTLIKSIKNIFNIAIYQEFTIPNISQ